MMCTSIFDVTRKLGFCDMRDSGILSSHSLRVLARSKMKQEGTETHVL